MDIWLIVQIKAYLADPSAFAAAAPAAGDAPAAAEEAAPAAAAEPEEESDDDMGLDLFGQCIDTQQTHSIHLKSSILSYLQLIVEECPLRSP